MAEDDDNLAFLMSGALYKTKDRKGGETTFFSRLTFLFFFFFLRAMVTGIVR
jgi:hypothetical protein